MDLHKRFSPKDAGNHRNLELDKRREKKSEKEEKRECFFYVYVRNERGRPRVYLIGGGCCFFFISFSNYLHHI